jgi:hypothetical protein
MWHVVIDAIDRSEVVGCLYLALFSSDDRRETVAASERVAHLVGCAGLVVDHVVVDDAASITGPRTEDFVRNTDAEAAEVDVSLRNQPPLFSPFVYWKRVSMYERSVPSSVSERASKRTVARERFHHVPYSPPV